MNENIVSVDNNDIANVLGKYDAKLLDISKVPSFFQWSLNHFTHPNFIGSPYSCITIQLDITAAYKSYKNNYILPGVSFITYFMFMLKQTLSEFSILNTRFLGGKWYQFKDPPVFMPIAIKGDNKYSNIVIENITDKNWTEFVGYYRELINTAKEGNLSAGNFSPVSPVLYQSVVNITNLPGIIFSSYIPSTAFENSGKQLFILGGRYFSNEKLIQPLSMTFNHANSDGGTISNFLQCLNNKLLF